MPGEEQIVKKLGEIPVVNDGWNTALSYYSMMKDYNSWTKFAFDATESGVKKAVAISSPVIEHFQPQINTINDYACEKLDAIESKYPLVKQPSSEVKTACIEYAEPVVGRVKPVVTYVQGVVDNSKRQVVQIKNYSTNLVAGARDLGVNTVSQAVNVTLDTPPGRLVTRTVDGVLNCAEGLLDKYIPEEPLGESVSDGGADPSNTSTEKKENVVEMEQMDPSPQRVAIHFTAVSKKVRERMFRRAMKNYSNAKVRTMDTINKLHSAVDLIDYAKKNLEAARGKVEDLWTQITDTNDQPKEENDNTSASAVEERIVMIGRTLAHQLRSGISALEKAYTEAGQFVRHPITKSKDFTEFFYQLKTDIRNVSVEKAHVSLQTIQTKLKTYIDNMNFSESLAVDIDMEGINMDEDSTEPSEEDDDEAEIPVTANHI